MGFHPSKARLPGQLPAVTLSASRGALQSGGNFAGRLTFRDECLNDTLFWTLTEARSAITSWKEDYNHYRPHSALGNMTPAEFALKSTLEKQAA